MDLIAMSEEWDELYLFDEGGQPCYVEIRPDMLYDGGSVMHIYAEDARFWYRSNQHTSPDLPSLAEVNARYPDFPVKIPDHFKTYTILLNRGEHIEDVKLEYFRRVPLQDLRSLCNGSLGEQGAALLMGASRLLKDAACYEYFKTWSVKFTYQEITERMLAYYTLSRLGYGSYDRVEDPRYIRNAYKTPFRSTSMNLDRHYEVGLHVFLTLFPERVPVKTDLRRAYQAIWSWHYYEYEPDEKELASSTLRLYADYIVGKVIRIYHAIFLHDPSFLRMGT